MSTNSPIIQRKAVRGVLLSDCDEVLLLKTIIPDTGLLLWITPGGGVDQGESTLECLSRELWEEIGYRPSIESARCIWLRRHTFLFNSSWFDQSEEYFLIRTAKFSVNFKNNSDQIEIATLQEYRWWTVREILDSTENFAPKLLGSLLQKILKGEVPDPPIEVGA